jgi:Fe-S oxidoreductase
MAFTEQERLTAMTSCRFCPMCHHADLSATLTRRETYSARGRGLTLWAIEKGKLPWDSSVADVMYKFSADGLSRHVCAGHINHDELVIDARRRLVRAGAAPEAVAAVKSRLGMSGNPWGEPEPDVAALSGAKAGARSELLVYFGPAARVRRQGVVKALGKLLSRAGVPFGALPAEGDPGLLLYQLGYAEDGQAAARALQEKISRSGARTVVTPDPDAYRALKSGFGDVPGVQGVKVLHASECLEELARGGKLRFRGAGTKIAYHDPCALARFAPCIDPPRALLKAVAGQAPLELGWSRDRAWCSGECGGLPFTNPELARAAAQRVLVQAGEAGAEVIVTASPAGAILLGEGARDLTELAAESLLD